MTTYIYALIDPITNYTKYVGKSNKPKDRIRIHIHNARFNKTSNVHLCRWINSLLSKGLEPQLKIIEEVDVGKWKEREIYWISFYKKEYKICNKHEGGIEPPSSLGRKWTEQQKQNLSLAKKGKKIWTDKNPHPLLGKPHPAKG